MLLFLLLPCNAIKLKLNIENTIVKKNVSYYIQTYKYDYIHKYVYEYGEI